MQQQPVERFHPTSGRVTAVLVARRSPGSSSSRGWPTRARSPAPVIAGAVLAACSPGPRCCVPRCGRRRSTWSCATCSRRSTSRSPRSSSWPCGRCWRCGPGRSATSPRWSGARWRKAMRTGRLRAAPPAEDTAPAPGLPYADFVEQRLHQLMEEARTAAGVRLPLRRAAGAGRRRTPRARVAADRPDRASRPWPSWRRCWSESPRSRPWSQAGGGPDVGRDGVEPAGGRDPGGVHAVRRGRPARRPRGST